MGSRQPPGSFLPAVITLDIIENSNGIWRGDIQEQRGPFMDCGQAACRGWTARFARKMGLVAGALFFRLVFFGRPHHHPSRRLNVAVLRLK